MALSDIEIRPRGIFKRKYFSITDNSLISLVTAFAGYRIEIYKMRISSDTAAKWALKSGSNNLFDFYGGASWGYCETDLEVPLFVTETGEALTIQSDVASLNANVQLWYRQVFV